MSEPVWIDFEHIAEEEEEEEDQKTGFASFTTNSDAMLPTPPSRIPPSDSGNLEIEYKYFKDMQQSACGRNSGIQWEDEIKNRRARVPREPDSIWLVSDALWNSDRPCHISRLVQADILSRCVQLDLEFALSMHFTPLSRRRRRSGCCANAPSLNSSISTPCPSDRLLNFAIDTPKVPPCSSQEIEPSFPIEAEFNALADHKLSSSAKNLAMEAPVCGLASKVSSLRHESALLKAGKQRELTALRAEVAALKEVATRLTQDFEASSQQHAGEVERLRQEQSDLQLENSQLKEVAALQSKAHEVMRAELNWMKAAVGHLKLRGLADRA